MTHPNVTPARPLNLVQEWLQAVIMHPHGVEAGIDSDDARDKIDVSPEQVEQVIARSSHLTSVERLQIYANAYYARLLECLREEFPALVHALGEDGFGAFAFGYLQTYPSRSYTLCDLGRDFPKYLAETRPSSDTPADGSASWPDFLIDLATLERTYSEVFDGPGPEGQPPLRAAELAAISPDDWPHARLIPAESLRLLVLKYPVHEYASAVRNKESPELLQPSPTWLVITRRDFVVRRAAVSQTEYELLDALAAGDLVGVAIERVATRSAMDLSSLATQLHTWFREWSAAGYFRRVELSPSRTCKVYG